MAYRNTYILLVALLLPLNLAQADDDVNALLIERGSPALKPAPYLPTQVSYDVATCKENWQDMQAILPVGTVETMCQCVATKMEETPLRPGDRYHLAGPGGMRNIGPWPEIEAVCMEPFFAAMGEATAPKMEQMLQDSE